MAFMDSKEAAKYLGVSYSTLLSMNPPRFKHGNKYYYTQKALDKFQEECMSKQCVESESVNVKAPPSSGITLPLEAGGFEAARKKRHEIERLKQQHNFTVRRRRG